MMFAFVYNHQVGVFIKLHVSRLIAGVAQLLNR